MPNYKYVKAPDDYPGDVYSWGYRVLEHHLVWWQNTGEVVPLGHIIHHKNGDTFDNRFDNLELMEWGAHTSMHKLDGRPLYTVVTCEWCDVEIQRRTGIVKRKTAAGHKSFCCSSHAAKYGNKKNRRKKTIEEAGHGTQGGYRRGCRCALCRAGNTERHRRYTQNKKKMGL